MTTCRRECGMQQCQWALVLASDGAATGEGATAMGQSAKEDRFQGASATHSHVSPHGGGLSVTRGGFRRKFVTFPPVSIPLPTRKSASMSITIPMAHP